LFSRKIKIFPSILAADFSRLGEEIKAVEAATADGIHIDVMDGRFVPNLTVGPMVVGATRGVTSLPLDVHLMIVEPDHLIPEFIKMGATCITVHVEACPHLHRTIQHIRRSGAHTGIAINPATPLSTIEEMVSEIDLLLIMTVNPGFGGQKFIPAMRKKIETARKMIDESGRAVALSVDGGIGIDNIRSLADAGADVFVSGSAIFCSPHYPTTLGEMRRAIEA